MAALNIEACLSVKAPEVAHDVVFQRRLVMLRLPVVQVLQPVTSQQLLVGLLIVLQDNRLREKGQAHNDAIHLVDLEVRYGSFKIVAGSGGGVFEPESIKFSKQLVTVTRAAELEQFDRSLTAGYLRDILWVAKPRTGSTTTAVAMSS